MTEVEQKLADLVEALEVFGDCQDRLTEAEEKYNDCPPDDYYYNRDDAGVEAAYRAEALIEALRADGHYNFPKKDVKE